MTTGFGVPDVNVSNWYSIVSVGGSPKPVVKRLYDEIVRALAAPDMVDRLAVSGLEPGGITPEQFRRKIEEELVRWKRVIKDAGIKQE